MVAQPDGKAIFTGTARMGSMQFPATRYNADGTIDSTYGTGG